MIQVPCICVIQLITRHLFALLPLHVTFFFLFTYSRLPLHFLLRTLCQEFPMWKSSFVAWLLPYTQKVSDTFSVYLGAHILNIHYTILSAWPPTRIFRVRVTRPVVFLISVKRQHVVTTTCSSMPTSCKQQRTQSQRIQLSHLAKFS